jgi:hypothetical protein
MFLFTDLDELSLWLRSDEQYGHAILFSLIFITTIRKSAFYFDIAASLIPAKSPHSAVLYTYRSIGIHFRPMDGCYYILFRSSDRRCLCIYPLSRPPPQIHRTLASFLHVSQACCSCDRKATQVAVSNPTRALPLQCDELSTGGVTYSDTSYLHRLHGPLLVQSDHSHQSWGLHSFFQGLSC